MIVFFPRKQSRPDPYTMPSLCNNVTDSYCNIHLTQTENEIDSSVFQNVGLLFSAMLRQIKFRYAYAKFYSDSVYQKLLKTVYFGKVAQNEISHNFGVTVCIVGDNAGAYAGDIIGRHASEHPV